MAQAPAPGFLSLWQGIFSEQPVVNIPRMSQGGHCSALHRTTNPEYIVVLRLQLEPEHGSFLLLLADRTSKQMVGDCLLQPNSLKSSCKDDSAPKQEISENRASAALKILKLDPAAMCAEGFEQRLACFTKHPAVSLPTVVNITYADELEKCRRLRGL